MRTLLFTIGLACLFSGCSGGGVGVSGKVTLNDGDPVPRGVVTLNSADGTFRGSIQSDGTYVIEGVPSGTFGVSVTGAMDSMPTEDGMTYDDEGNVVESESAEPNSLIDEKYASPDTSGLTLTVPGSYDLKLDASSDSSGNGASSDDGAKDGSP